MVDIVDSMFNIAWVGYLFCAFKASFNFYQKLLDIHHIYYIKINLAMLHDLLRDHSINFITTTSVHQTYYIQVLHSFNYLIDIINLGYLTTISLIYYHQTSIYHLIMIYLDAVNIYYHIQPVIYINNLQFIITDYIFYLHQTLLYSISFEYINIV